MKITEILTDLGSPVSFFPALARIFGVREALMLQQLIYWTGKQTNPDGWIYKSSIDWREELCLSPKEQRTVRKNLRELGVIEEKEARLEHRIYFRIVPEKIQQVWETNSPSEKSADAGGAPQQPKGTFGDDPKGNSGYDNEAFPRARDSASESTPKNTPTQKADHDPFAGVQLPAILDVPAFHVAWIDSQKARKEQGHPPLKRTGIKQRLAQLTPYGPETAAAALRMSIANGWKGVFPEKISTRSSHYSTAEAAPSPRYPHNWKELLRQVLDTDLAHIDPEIRKKQLACQAWSQLLPSVQAEITKKSIKK